MIRSKYRSHTSQFPINNQFLKTLYHYVQEGKALNMNLIGEAKDRDFPQKLENPRCLFCSGARKRKK